MIFCNHKKYREIYQQTYGEKLQVNKGTNGLKNIKHQQWNIFIVYKHLHFNKRNLLMNNHHHSQYMTHILHIVLVNVLSLFNIHYIKYKLFLSEDNIILGLLIEIVLIFHLFIYLNYQFSVVLLTNKHNSNNCGLCKCYYIHDEKITIQMKHLITIYLKKDILIIFVCACGFEQFCLCVVLNDISKVTKVLKNLKILTQLCRLKKIKIASLFFNYF